MPCAEHSGQLQKLLEIVEWLRYSELLLQIRSRGEICMPHWLGLEQAPLVCVARAVKDCRATSAVRHGRWRLGGLGGAADGGVTVGGWTKPIGRCVSGGLGQCCPASSEQGNEQAMHLSCALMR